MTAMTAMNSKTMIALPWHGLPARETALSAAGSGGTGDSPVFRTDKPLRNSNTWASRPCHAILSIHNPTIWQPVPHNPQ